MSPKDRVFSPLNWTAGSYCVFVDSHTKSDIHFAY